MKKLSFFLMAMLLTLCVTNAFGEVYFSDSFSNVGTGSNATVSSRTGWSSLTQCYGQYNSGLRIGSSKNAGSITKTAMSNISGTKNLKVTIYTAKYNNDGNSFTITATNGTITSVTGVGKLSAGTLTVSPTGNAGVTGTTSKATWTDSYKTEFIISGATSSTTIKFATNKRAILGPITIEDEAASGDDEIETVDLGDLLKWSATSATATVGADDNEFPTLTNTNDVAVSYTSSTPATATIDASTGAITLVAAGTTTISAFYEGGDDAGEGKVYAAKTVSYTLTVKPAPLVIEPIEGGIVDILTHETFGVKTTSYTSFSGKQATNDNHSDAVYAGKTARNGSATQYNIQLNQLKDGRQFATTTSGGLAKRVYVKWATQTANANARELYIYGSNTAFTGSETSTSSTKIGAIKYTTGAAEAYVDLTGDYKYILITGSGAIYMDEIQVTWVVAEGTVTTPTISGADEFIESTEVTISAEDGLKVYYTLDGTDPTNASTEYTAPFELTATTTVKAVAYDGEKASDIASQTFKKLQVLTCEEAADTCTSTESADKYVIRGYVTNVKYAYNEEFKTATFWIADTKNGGQVLQAYSAKPVAETDKAVKVGDYVETIGNLKLYNTTPEITNGTYAIIPAPVVNYTITVCANPAEAGIVTSGGEYEETDEITVTATANEGYEFVNWTENDEEVSTEAEYTFEVLADRNLVANFVALPAPEVKSGKFSVCENKLATFAPGNLQFNIGDSTWRFAYEQYKSVGKQNINIGDPAFKGWIDMFGWSTAETYYGVNPSNSNELYDGEFVDWGNVFEGENWSTLSADEWNYLLNTRANAAQLKQIATIDTVLGIMLFPDAWVMPEGIEVAAKLDTNYNVNVYNYTVAQWDALEDAGAIFLPAAGRRTGGYGNMINYNQEVETREDYLVNGGYYRWFDNQNIYCYYWTSTINEEKNVSYLHNIVALGNDNYTIGTGAIWGEKGRYGQSVRLAQVEVVNHIISVSANNPEWGTVTGAGEYEDGATATITATPNFDYVFVNWTLNGEVVSSEATYTFTVTADAHHEANFKEVSATTVSKSGVFSISAHKTATFATGNLQYHTSDKTWRFAKQQYQVVGEQNIEVGNPDFKGWIDMFGWSTSETYFGVDPSNSNELYDGEFVDWGKVFEGENWSTLSADEWKYLLNTRANATQLKQIATVDTLLGIMLFPDAWVMPESIDVTAKLDTAYNVNVYNYTIAQWEALEAAGAIFLPAAGRRTGGYGNMINYDQEVETREDYLVNGGFYRWHDNTNIYCYYWTSTINEEKNVSYLHNIVDLGNDEYTIGTGAIWGEKGRYGQSVRLAKVAYDTHTVEVTAENGTVEGAGTYEHGATATLTAVANDGYEFLGWTVDDEVVSTDESYTFEVTSDLDIVANFDYVYEFVYFVNAFGWDEVYAYVWNETGNNEWPGVQLEKAEYQLYGFDVYGIGYPELSEITHIIFNNGHNGEGNQTADLDWTPDNYYIIDRWYSEDELINPPYTATGSSADLFGTEWDPTNTDNDLTLQEDGTYRLVKENVILAAGNIEYKGAVHHSWNWYTYPEVDNAVLTIETAGTYHVTFTLNVDTEELTAVATPVTPSTPTALDNINTSVAPVKAFVNGQLIIIKNGIQYNAQGQVVK